MAASRLTVKEPSPHVETSKEETTAEASVGPSARAGSQYVLGLRAKDCNTGNTLDQQQVAVTRREEVLDALSEMSRKFRTRAGESLATVEKHSMPISEATTPSFEAFKAYSTAIQLKFSSGSPERSIPLLRRAIEIDPNFAMAYAHLGFDYGRSDSALSAEYATKAWLLRDRVSDRERFYIDFTYERQVTGNLEKAYTTLELWSQTYPRRGAMLANAQDLLGGISTQGTGRFERTIEAALDGIVTEPALPYPYINLALAQFYLDRFPAAEDTIQRATVRKVQVPQLLMLQYNPRRLRETGNRWTGLQVRQAEIVRLDTGSPTRRHSLLPAPAGYGRRGGRPGALWTWPCKEGNAKSPRLSSPPGPCGRPLREFRRSTDGRHGLPRTVDGPRCPIRRRSCLGALEKFGRSEALSGDLEKRFPEDTFVKFTYAPVLRALALQGKGKFADSIERLEIARSYELAVTSLNFPYLILGRLHSAYARG